MTSKPELDPYALELPEPTAEDLAALERAERRVQLSPEEYLQFLEAMTKDLPADRTFEEDAGREPFAL